MDSAVTVVFSLVAFLLALFAGLMWLTSASCHAKWADYSPKWSVLGECQIQIDGKWIPTDAVKEVKP